MADKERANQSFVLHLVIDADIAACYPFHYGIAYVAEKLGMQQAVVTGDHSVGAFCKKTDYRIAVLQLYGINRLVAIVVNLRRGQSRRKLNVQSADSAHIVLYPSVFDFKLLVIGDMAQRAAAAAAECAAAVASAQRRG